MPTIEYGGNPSAYGDIRGGVISTGPNWYDDILPTEVVASAKVYNTEGTAAGKAYIRITNNMTRETTPGVARTIPAGGSQDVGVRYSVGDNRLVNLTVEVIDDNSDMRIGEPRTFTVNSYEIPQVANLTSGDISITVN